MAERESHMSEQGGVRFVYVIDYIGNGWVAHFCDRGRIKPVAYFKGLNFNGPRRGNRRSSGTRIGGGQDEGYA